MNVILDLDPEPTEIGPFLLFHLIYGAVLGAWVGVGGIDYSAGSVEPAGSVEIRREREIDFVENVGTED